MRKIVDKKIINYQSVTSRVGGSNPFALYNISNDIDYSRQLFVSTRFKNYQYRDSN